MIEILADNINITKTRSKSQPVYEQIRRQIRQMIRSGEFEDGQELPSISSLSKMLKVNYRTIKAAFELLEKEDGLLNCEPNRRPVVSGPFLGSVRAAESLCFGFIRMTGDEFFISASKGIKRYTDEHNINCLFIDAANDHDRVMDAILHPGSSVSGLILLPIESPEYYEAISEALKKGTAMVFFDRTLPNLNVSSVCADHFMGAYLATQHLLENYSRPVYFIGTTMEPSSCRERVAGWRSAMHSFNFTSCNSYLVEIGYSDIELTEVDMAWAKYEIDAAMKFFDSHDEQAFSIVASNDYMARAIYEAADKKGLIIGRDINIVGFGDLPMSSRLPVGLSSVDQCTEEVGYEAAKALFETISGTMPKPVQRVLPVDLIIRDSSRLSNKSFLRA